MNCHAEREMELQACDDGEIYLNLTAPGLTPHAQQCSSDFSATCLKEINILKAKPVCLQTLMPGFLVFHF